MSVSHRLLRALASDFYRPFRLTELHEAVYPDEFFRPDSSPAKLHQAFLQFRRWLAQQAPGIKLEEVHGEYRLCFLDGWGLRLSPPDGEAPRDREAFQRRQLFAALGDDWFTSRGAAERLGVSQRTALRLLAEGVAEGELERTGTRAAARYRFKGRG